MIKHNKQSLNSDSLWQIQHDLKNHFLLMELINY
jgi:hypothetical protein